MAGVRSKGVFGRYFVLLTNKTKRVVYTVDVII